MFVAAALFLSACGDRGSEDPSTVADGQSPAADGAVERADFRDELPRSSWSGEQRAARLITNCIDLGPNAPASSCFSLLTGSYQSGELGSSGEAIVDEYESTCGAVGETFYHPDCGDLLQELRDDLVATHGEPPSLNTSTPPRSEPAVTSFEPPAASFGQSTGQNYVEVETEHLYGEFVISSCDGLFFDDGIGEIGDAEASYNARGVVARELEADETFARLVVAVFDSEREAETVVVETADRWASCWSDPSAGVPPLATTSSVAADELLEAHRLNFGDAPASHALGRSGPVVVMAVTSSGSDGPVLSAASLAEVVFASR